MPDFWERRLGFNDARQLCDAAGVSLRVVPMPAAAAVPPPLFGTRKLYLSEYLPSAARAFVTIHELTHIASGHADELTEIILDESRYPVEDRIADAVAAVAITTPAERELPVADLAALLRERVPVDSRAWQVYRSNDVAELIRVQPDLGRWGDR